MWRLDHDLIGRTGEVSKFYIDGFSLLDLKNLDVFTILP
jgi:hypothetical protein